MGYSYCTESGKSLENVMQSRAPGDLYGAEESRAAGGYGHPCGNGWLQHGARYFFEYGREQDDGAITFTVYKCNQTAGTCHKTGAGRIEPDGYITRWPALSSSMAAERDRINQRIQQQRDRQQAEQARYMASLGPDCRPRANAPAPGPAEEVIDRRYSGEFYNLFGEVQA